MNSLLVAMFNLRRRLGDRRAHAVIALDPELELTAVDCRRWMEPWRERLVLHNVQLVRREEASSFAPRLRPGPRSFVVGASESSEFLRQLRKRCEDLGLAFVDSAPPGPDSPDAGFFHELSFHDFEIGGRNERDGSPPMFSPNILNHLSATFCREVFPLKVWDRLERRAADDGGRKIRALDIGCGPLSRLRWGALQGKMEVVGVDPLSEMYAIVLARHGLSDVPHVRCDREYSMMAEDLSALPYANYFDLVFSNNALDHSRDPARILRQIRRMLTACGVCVLRVATREGSRQNWEGLHQFDFYLAGDERLVAETRAGRVTDLLPPGCGLEIREIWENTESDLSFLLGEEGAPG